MSFIEVMRAAFIRGETDTVERMSTLSANLG